MKRLQARNRQTRSAYCRNHRRAQTHIPVHEPVRAPRSPNLDEMQSAAQVRECHNIIGNFEYLQRVGLFDLALHMFPKQRHPFGVAQITVLQQPQPQFMLLLRFTKPCQFGVAVAQKAGQKPDAQTLFHCRKCQRGFVDVKLVLSLRPGLPGPDSVILAAIHPNPFFRRPP